MSEIEARTFKRMLTTFSLGITHPEIVKQKLKDFRAMEEAYTVLGRSGFFFSLPCNLAISSAFASHLAPATEGKLFREQLLHSQEGKSKQSPTNSAKGI